MSNGFVLGTLAAISWGFADVLVTYLTRRGGFFRTLLFTQIFGVALLLMAKNGLSGYAGWTALGCFLAAAAAARLSLSVNDGAPHRTR